MKIKQIDYKELNTSIFGEYKQEYHKQLMDLIQQANKESSAFEAHVTKGHCSYESLLKNKNA